MKRERPNHNHKHTHHTYVHELQSVPHEQMPSLQKPGGRWPRVPGRAGPSARGAVAYTTPPAPIGCSGTACTLYPPAPGAGG